MAYRRSIIARSKLFYQQQQPRFAPSFSHISSSSIDREELTAKTISRNSEYPFRFPRYNNAANSLLVPGNVSRLMRSNIPAGHGLLFHRNYSEVPEVLYEGGGDLNGMMGTVVEKAVEVAAPVVNEVAIAAADSFAPVAAFQYLIDYVYCYTGFQWWASIAATALLINFIQLPLVINRMKYYSVYLTHNQKLLMSLMECIAILSKKKDPSNEQLKDVMDALVSNLMNVFRAIPLFRHNIPKVTLAIWFFAILNMAEKVPSFRTGGILWFTDLTTPDRMYLPILFALTLWTRLELNRYCTASTGIHLIKYKSAVVLAGAVAAGFPPAIYCYLITSNLFYIAYPIVTGNPRALKLLGISMKPPSTGK